MTNKIIDINKYIGHEFEDIMNRLGYSPDNNIFEDEINTELFLNHNGLDVCNACGYIYEQIDIDISGEQKLCKKCGGFK
jgi:hypothetical protein